VSKEKPLAKTKGSLNTSLKGKQLNNSKIQYIRDIKCIALCLVVSKHATWQINKLPSITIEIFK